MPTIEISKLIAKGNGLTYLNKKTGFIPFSLPDESININIIEEKTKTFTGQILKVITPSKNRITPACSVYGECGGCSYQHTSYEEQLKIKQSVFEEQLQFIGNQTLKPIAIHPSPNQWEYRNKVEWKIKLIEGKIFPSLVHWRPANGLVVVDQCHIIKPNLSTVTGLTKDCLEETLSTKQLKHLNKISIQEFQEKEIYIALSFSSSPKAKWSNILEPLLNDVWFNRLDVEIFIQGNKIGTYSTTATNTPFLQTVLDNSIQVSGGSFMQINQKQFDRILTKMKEWASNSNDRKLLLDFYSGAGSISFSLMDLFEKTRGFELAGPSIQNAKELSKTVTHNIEFDAVNLEKQAPELDILPKHTTAILDPPRRGLSKEVFHWILKNKPESIYYLSCDGATFSRDVKSLAEAYKIEEVHLWDMFPQTHHLEVLGRLALKN